MKPLARIALWGPLLVAAVLVGAYVWVHRPGTADGTELLQVPLSSDDAELSEVGQLTYLGGLDIPRMGENIGGLSGLRWDAESGRLLAITDDARWVWMSLEEQGDRLTGIAAVEVGNLLGVDGEPLQGKESGDSESLVRDEDGAWGVSFERDHRILLYQPEISSVPVKTFFEPEVEFGRLPENGGIEAFAVGNQSQLLCAERRHSEQRANCLVFDYEQDAFAPFSAVPPQELIELGAVPTDADALSDGTYLILFRSYSPVEGNSAAIVAYAPDGARREIASLRPPLNVDNFEGLAVREEGEGDAKRTFLYIVSDDNFSGNQRTLLMKFALDPDADS